MTKLTNKQEVLLNELLESHLQAHPDQRPVLGRSGTVSRLSLWEFILSSSLYYSVSHNNYYGSIFPIPARLAS